MGCSDTDMMYILVIGVVVYMWYNSRSSYIKNSGTVNMNDEPNMNELLPETPLAPSKAAPTGYAGPKPLVSGGSINNSQYDLAGYRPSGLPESDPDGTWNSKQLLPANGAIDFQDTNFLTPMKQTGQWLDALRNANHQIRRDPDIKRRNVGPWSNSTINPDVWRESIDPVIDPIQ